MFCNLDYGIPLTSCRILCWDLALISHLGVLLRTQSTKLEFSPISEMSKSYNYGLPKSRGTSIPHEDDIPRFDRGTRNHASLPPPPPIILPHPQVLEKFKVTQSLLESIVYVCSHLGDKFTYWQAGRVGCQSPVKVGCSITFLVT